MSKDMCFEKIAVAVILLAVITALKMPSRVGIVMLTFFVSIHIVIGLSLKK